MGVSAITNFPNGVSSYGMAVLPGFPATLKRALYVDTNHANASDGNSGLDADFPLSTIGQAMTNAQANDAIHIAAGDYDEVVTINKDNLTLIGVGPRGSVAVAPSGANDIAIVIDGTGAGGRVEEVSLTNIGGEGKGTGGGLHIKGDIRRLRFYGCKFEGGTFGVKLESTALGAVSDLHFDDVEFAWTTRGLHITASGGGDPVTNIWVREGIFHNNSLKWILADVAHTTGLIVKDSVFDLEEDGSAAASNQLDVAVASSQGIFSNNSFALATMAVAKLAIAAGILWVGNKTEAGVGGRPS